MADPSEQILVILERELGSGCQDATVRGGIDALVGKIRSAPAFPRSSPVQKAVALLPASGYGSLAPEGRREWLGYVIAALRSPSVRKVSAKAVGRKKPATRPRAATPRRPAAIATYVRGLDSPVTDMAGVSAATASKLERLEVRTIRDLATFYPFRYNDFSATTAIRDLRPGLLVTVVGSVWSAQETRIGRRMRGTEAIISDGSGNLRCTWFNQPWVARQLPQNARVALSGRVDVYRGRLQMENPDYELIVEGAEGLHTGRVVPVYRLTAGLPMRTLRKLVRSAVDAFADDLPDPVPAPVATRLGLEPLPAAVRQMHYPESLEKAEAARRRIALGEFMTIHAALLGARKDWDDSSDAPPLSLEPDQLDGFLESLPFALTGAQERVLAQVLEDIDRTKPMARLVQGDVGSGKTVVALVACLAAVASGCQAAIMAPTEVLAEQHHRTVRSILGEGEGALLEGMRSVPGLNRPVRVALLTGSMSETLKRQVRAAIAAGQYDIIIGTHALITEQVSIDNLGLAIVDEQHRFGVMQRAALKGKGSGSPHLLVMTATPIPRTLALTLYGDLDISTIGELPPGRQPIETHFVHDSERDEWYQKVRREVHAGRQAFVICPLVEESEAVVARAATEEYERLKAEVFTEERLALLHGRMAAREKDSVMRAFVKHETDILVSTAVVEVGIDVPNATVMLIEGADRFGLAQLHQFRGRVGRGAQASYCLLLADDPSDEAVQRLELMEQESDGFKLAEADLQMRGPGEYTGTRQSGLADLKVARLTDGDLIETSRSEVRRILEEDPHLQKPDHANLAAAAAAVVRGQDIPQAS
jgi:ATP-dependent DNA helicase RecG